jgi:hypothetical protein
MVRHIRQYRQRKGQQDEASGRMQRICVIIIACEALVHPVDLSIASRRFRALLPTLSRV